MVMLKRLRDPQFWFIVLIPTVITYITLAQFFGAGLGIRFNDVLEVVSFLLFVAVPAVLMGVLTVGVVLMGEHGWTRWRERRKAKDPGHQLFLLATEIEQCKCLIRSIKLGMTDEELSEYRETVQEELRVLVTCPPRTGPGVMLVLGLKERGVKMARRKHTAEQIINKLREAEVAISAGSTVAEVSRQIGVTQQTFYRWRTEYGGLKIDQARRLKQLETENGRLRRAVADLTLDNQILREAAEGNF